MTEDKLIQRAAKGDSRAFDELLGVHERKMYALCLRMCGNPDDAQDCLQEAMLRVFRSLKGFKGDSAFSTWLYRVTMSACLDELRRRKSRPSMSLDTLVEAGWSPADADPTPEQHAITAQTQVEVQRMISELGEDMRAAVVLRDIHGCSYEEIARILGINIGTIKSRISRGREKLREKISAHPELF